MTAPARPSNRPPETWTVIRLIRWTSDYFQDKGLDTPRLDAEVLLADLLGLDRVGLYVNFDRPLNPDELAAYRERVKRRAAREPAAYITGRREFYSLDLAVSPAVLIPRPETELLVDEALALAGRRRPPLALCDLGTGSGAVALALAHRLPEAEVHAVDVSPQALEVARANAAKLGLAERIEFFEGNLYEPVPQTGAGYDIITANLPYVPRPAFADMAPEVRDHEPRLSLDGGEDGLDLIRRAVAGAGPFLKPGGALLLEIWPDHGRELVRLAGEAGFARTRLIPDLAGRDRVAALETEGEQESHGQDNN